MTDTLDHTTPQERLDNDGDYFIACAEQQEVLIRFADGGLEIRQQDASGNDRDAVYVGEDNIRSFLGCIISQYRKAHGKHAAADLASYLCGIAGVPSTRDLDYGEPLIPTEPPPTESRSQKDPTAAERMRRYRERKRNSAATDRNACELFDRNAASA